jgi:glycosyltransferase involved in cell wall biosynthesis
MKKIIIISPIFDSLINFRGDLIQEIKNRNYEVITVSPAPSKQYLETFKDKKIINIPLNFERNKVNPFHDIYMFLKLIQIFWTQSPDIVLSYGIKPVIWGGLAAKFFRTNFYALVTGVGYAFQGDSFKRKLLTKLVEILYKFGLKGAKRVIFHNVENRNLFVEKKIVPESRTSIVDGSGVNIDRFNFEPPPKKDINFLCISRLLGEKGLREYAKAAEIVKRKYPDVSFNLVGPKDTSPDGIPLDEVMSWSNYLDYKGSTMDVRSYIKNTSVYILPSYHEGIPRSTLEAMAMGRPILTTDAVGCRDTVEQNVNGFKIPVGSIEKLVEKIIWFIENPESISKMGISSRKIVEQRFDVRKVNIEMLKILNIDYVKDFSHSKKIIIITSVPISFATLIRGQAKYLKKFYDVKLVSSYSNLNKQISDFEGVEFKSINMTRKITPIQDLKALYKLYKYISYERPNIVYTFTPKAGLLGMVASFLSRIPVRVHNIVGLPLMEYSGLKLLLLKYIEKLTYFFSTKIFCNSYGLKKYINDNLTKMPITVIGNGSINGVDTDFFKNNFNYQEKSLTRLKHNILKKDFVITFLGRIVRDKGINELIDSFQILLKKYPHLKLLLVGDYDDNLNRIDDKTRETISNSDSIINVGFKNDIREFLSITDLFVLPSYREGLPNSLIEAGSFGIPLLATNINGCNEIIENYETGLLIKMKDVDSLKKGMEKYITDKEFYFNIKNNVRSSIIKKYNQADFWINLNNEIKKII